MAGVNIKKGLAFICSVKQAHALFPKEFIAEKMKNAPSGTWLCMTASVDEVDVVCSGYKYNSRKTLFFCWPPGAASAIPGEPYIARFQDADGSANARNVPRLSVISRYFHHSNKVDIHNELRQGLLALEDA